MDNFAGSYCKEVRVSTQAGEYSNLVKKGGTRGNLGAGGGDDYTWSTSKTRFQLGADFATYGLLYRYVVRCSSGN